MQNNVELAKFTSFKIGGPAKYFVEAKTVDDFIAALKFAKENNLPFFILGSGTNILVRDQGFDGVVVRNQIKSFDLEGELVVVGTANTMVEVNQFANKNGFVGFEKLATVPGTLGGAVYNNAHYLDDLLSNYVQWVEIVDSDLNLKRLDKDQMEFAYDSSKVKKDNLPAVRVGLRLPKGDVAESRKKLLDLLKKRTDTQPYGTFNSGCMFQNVKQQLGPGNHGTSAGYLIDQVGLKGMKIGDAVISEKHCNFFVNQGHATSEDILKLAELAKQKVKEKYGVDLEFEVKII